MPRKPRNLYRGEYYHILNRGNNRQRLFQKDEDFEFYLRLLLRYLEKYNVNLYHYCLMTNHTHLLMRGDDANDAIIRLMHASQTAYAVYFKRVHETTGHVFENRFRHFHIACESYLLECGRYIERNPVRAGMAPTTAHYRWSSFQYYAYGISDLLLRPNPLYLGLAPTPKERQRAYQKYVHAPRAYESLVDAYFDERVLI